MDAAAQAQWDEVQEALPGPHSFASAALTAGGCNPWHLADQLGHADIDGAQVYGKLIPKDYQKPQTEKPKADLRLVV